MIKKFNGFHDAMAALKIAKRIGYDGYCTNERLRLGDGWKVVVTHLVNDRREAGMR